MLPSSLQKNTGVLNATAEYTFFTLQEKTGHTLTDTNLFRGKTMNDKKEKGFLEKWEQTTDKLTTLWLKLFKKLLKWVFKLIPIIVGYSIMSWMFIGVYDTIGFEKTLIILLVGVFWYGIRERAK